MAMPVLFSFAHFSSLPMTRHLAATNQPVSAARAVPQFTHAAGLVAYALLTATIVLGVMIGLRRGSPTVRRETLRNVHLGIAVATIAAAIAHAAPFLIIPELRLRPANLIVPFLGWGPRQFGVGLGIIGLELAIVVAGSVWLLTKLGYYRWLWVHRVAYVAFPLVWTHVVVLMPAARRPGLLGITVGVSLFVVVGYLVLGWLDRRSTGSSPIQSGQSR